MPTQADIIQAVRELSFDRFIIPGIAFKAIAGKAISIDPELLVIHTLGNQADVFYSADLNVLDTFDKLTDDLLQNEIIFAYTPYYSGVEKCANLIPVTNQSIASDYTAYKRYFFSDASILELIRYYYLSVLNIRLDIVDLETWIPKIIYPNENHLTLKVAYWVVDKRRLSEVAAQQVGLTYTDGSAYTSSELPGSTTERITVQIGSVFTLEENPHNGELTEKFNVLGSDNVLGDKYSFWYRLSLYLRSKLEEQFEDYSLRPNEVISSDSMLDRFDLNFRSYFDSYPFRFSPISRGIIA